MTFQGVFEAPELVPAPCGILSVADVTKHESRNDESWVRGFSYRFDSFATIRLLSENDDEVTGGTLYDATNGPTYIDCKPFFIESEVYRSALGVLGEDRFAEALRKLEAGTQKALEKELWDGVVTQAGSTNNIYLRTIGDTFEQAFSASDALFHLEQKISESPTGTGGVIHMTRDVASVLGAKLIYLPRTESKPGRVMTRLGTDVIIGSGYSGDGPMNAGGAAASDTNKWMYATGPVAVHLTKSEVVNENLGQGMNPRINDMIIKAVRAAAVYFDPSIYFAAQVSLPVPA